MSLKVEVELFGSNHGLVDEKSRSDVSLVARTRVESSVVTLGRDYESYLGS
jgi:hypothetical protein